MHTLYYGVGQKFAWKKQSLHTTSHPHTDVIQNYHDPFFSPSSFTMKDIERDRAVVVALWREGFSVNAIAKKVKKSETFIRKWIGRVEEGDVTLEDHSREGRPHKVGPTEAKFLRKKMYKVQSASPNQMSKELKKKNINVSGRTIARFTKSQGWKPYKITKTFFLTKANQKGRMSFVKKYEKLSESDWKTWLFTDEKKFVLFRPPQFPV